MKARNLFVIAVLLVAVLSTSGLAASFDPETFVFAGSGQPPKRWTRQLSTTPPAAKSRIKCTTICLSMWAGFGRCGPPLLATEVPTVANGLMSEDGRTIRVPIRQGVKFHNGAVLTAEDVRYSFIRGYAGRHGRRAAVDVLRTPPFGRANHARCDR